MRGTVVVTGGARGIGAATVAQLAANGYDVAINFTRDEASAKQVMHQAVAKGVNAVTVRADVSNESDVVAMFKTLDQCMPPLVGLVNNAGVLFKQCTLLELDAARIRRVLDVNVVGPMLCAREAIRRMASDKGGSGGAIVNVSSRASVLGSPNEYIDYAASKGALDSMTIGLSKEVAHLGIRVNGVRPGVVETEIHASGGEATRPQRVGPQMPIGRAGTAPEIASAIVWLLSDAASYCTGALLDVSGGR